MLSFHMFVATPPRLALTSFPGPTPTPRPPTPNSHGINLFADPHPLTPVASIFYKNIGWQGARPIRAGSDPQTSQRNNGISLSPLECADPKNASITPLECAVPKTMDLKSFRMRSSEKSGGRGQVVNQESDEDYCPEEHRNEASLFQ